MPVLAADITATNEARDSVVNLHDAWKWDSITNADTVKAQKVAKGKYLILVDGTPATVDFTVKFSKDNSTFIDYDTDLMPDGLHYNSASTSAAIMCLGDGWVDLTFNSVGSGSQDANVWFERLGDC